MNRRTPIALIAFAVLVALGYQEATSQERTPPVPSKQIPASSTIARRQRACPHTR